MTKKLYISDLDGTLLQPDATLSNYARDTLNEMLEDNDFHFTIATARSYETISQILKGLNLRLPVIEFNGNMITNFSTGNHLYYHHIELETVKGVIDTIKSYDCNPLISTISKGGDKLYFPDIYNGGIRWYYNEVFGRKDKRLQTIENYHKAFDEKISCLTTIASKSRIKVLYNIINEKYGNSLAVHYYENQYSPGWYWMLIYHVNATKDKAIKTLCENYGFDIKNLTVFGDNVNDISMMEVAGESVAMSNAVPVVKDYSSKIIGSNTEDAVVKYIIEELKDL